MLCKEFSFPTWLRRAHSNDYLLWTQKVLLKRLIFVCWKKKKKDKLQFQGELKWFILYLLLQQDNI